MTYNQSVKAGIFKDVSLTDGFEFDKVKEPYYQRLPAREVPLVQCIGRTKREPSKKCLDDARKIMGKKPYNQPGNYLVGDGYFARDCINRYGEAMWNAACKQVENE